jgi:phasin
MAEERDRFEIPNGMQSMAEAGLEQTRKAFEKFIAGAQAAADSLSVRTVAAGSGARDINAAAFSYAQKNVPASLDYAQSRPRAKDLSEILRLQREYAQAQVRALAEQASEMGRIMSRAATDATRPKT